MNKAVSTLEITLTKPLTFGEETIDKLVLREPVAKDFRELNASKPFAMVLDLAAILSGLPNSVIDQLNAADTMTVCNQVNGFLPVSQKTGGT